MAIVGASGSGKSTLLHIIGGLDTLTARRSGSGRSRAVETVRCRARPRAQSLARFHLPVPSPAARVHRAGERVHAAADPRHCRLREAEREAAEALLERVGLGRRCASQAGRAVRRRAPALRGGARAGDAARPACSATSRPAISIEDNAAQVYALMLELNREIGTSFVLVPTIRTWRRGWIACWSCTTAGCGPFVADGCEAAVPTRFIRCARAGKSDGNRGAAADSLPGGTGAAGWRTGGANIARAAARVASDLSIVPACRTLAVAWRRWRRAVCVACRHCPWPRSAGRRCARISPCTRDCHWHGKAAICW